MTFWNDRSEIVSVYRQLNDETAVVAYIMIDNLDELMQYVQEQYRTVVGQVESVLKEWAESVGGIFKEYERERYIFIFEAAHVREFIENKFDILDRVRNIKIGEGNMPVTISIGISSSFGGLADLSLIHILFSQRIQFFGCCLPLGNEFIETCFIVFTVISCSGFGFFKKC